MREKYESLSLAVLKDLAKTRGLKGVSALKKADLIERMLQEDEKEVAVEKAKAAEENGIKKTALMIIGDAVKGAKYDRSKLYDPEFTTEFREAVKSKTHHS